MFSSCQGENNSIKSQILRFSQRYHPETEHLTYVSEVAGILYDKLVVLHGLGDKEKELLIAAALLHDIGLSRGVKGHHKASMEIILNAGIHLQFPPDEIQLIALVTRYHRRALPKETHPVYCDLDDRKKVVVNTLASILRVADALDRRHLQVIEPVNVSIYESIIILYLISRLDACEDEITALGRKKDLFSLVFQKDLEIRLDVRKNV